MWILPSRGRPHNVERLLKAYIETGASTPVWLRIDLDDSVCGAYRAPHPMWTRVIGPRKILSELYAEAFRMSRDSPWFGFIADDVVPETEKWDTKLIELAGRDGMAVPSGGHADYHGSPHFVLGGDLVRSVGWLALPGLDRIFIDTVWFDIARVRDVLRHAPGVVLRHLHFSNKGALMDATYLKHRKVEDRALYESWRKDGYNSLVKGGTP